MTAHDFTFTDINLQPLSLAEFRGRPLLIVNTASECDYTSQYSGLQKLWERYRARGSNSQFEMLVLPEKQRLAPWLRLILFYLSDC